MEEVTDITFVAIGWKIFATQNEEKMLKFPSSKCGSGAHPSGSTSPHSTSRTCLTDRQVNSETHSIYMHMRREYKFSNDVSIVCV